MTITNSGGVKIWISTQSTKNRKTIVSIGVVAVVVSGGGLFWIVNFGLSGACLEVVVVVVGWAFIIITLYIRAEDKDW
jgi:hypothetical protein